MENNIAAAIDAYTQAFACAAIATERCEDDNEEARLHEAKRTARKQLDEQLAFLRGKEQAWLAVWALLKEVKPSFDDCYPLSGQEAAVNAIRELAAVQQGYMPAQAVVQIQEPERNKPSMSMHVSVEDYQRALADWEAEQSQLAAVQQGVQQIKANCYSGNDGDSWRDCPDDCDFVEGLKVGDTFELQASVRSWSETFRVTKAPDDGNDDYEVELVSSDAPFATQQELDAPTLDDAWKARLLDGAPLERDKYGCGYHPALPTFDEGVNGARFFAVFGIELMARMAECEMDSEAYEVMTESAFTEDGPNYNAWTPAKPNGDGWCLVAVFDTEDGPACWWVRAAQAKQGGV